MSALEHQVPCDDTNVERVHHYMPYIVWSKHATNQDPSLGYGFNMLLFIIIPKELMVVWLREVQCGSFIEQSAYT